MQRFAEDETNAIQVKIICLKNDVLHGYMDKEKAASYFTVYQSQLLKLNSDIVESIQAESTERLTRQSMLQQEYDKNMILYHGKLKQAERCFAKEKLKLIQEAVHISLYLTNLAQQIRENKK